MEAPMPKKRIAWHPLFVAENAGGVAVEKPAASDGGNGETDETSKPAAGNTTPAPPKRNPKRERQ
jgi:hypothetical protein